MNVKYKTLSLNFLICYTEIHGGYTEFHRVNNDFRLTGSGLKVLINSQKNSHLNRQIFWLININYFNR